MKIPNAVKYTGFGILGFGFIVLAIFVTMSLWNWLIPQLFNGPEMNFWQTAGLFLLSKILLTGVAPGSHDKRYNKEWRSKYHQKFIRRTDEDESVTSAPIQ